MVHVSYRLQPIESGGADADSVGPVCDKKDQEYKREYM
jgi:hypothetical protein